MAAAELFLGLFPKKVRLAPARFLRDFGSRGSDSNANDGKGSNEVKDGLRGVLERCLIYGRVQKREFPLSERV